MARRWVCTVHNETFPATDNEAKNQHVEDNKDAEGKPTCVFKSQQRGSQFWELLERIRETIGR